LKDIEGIGIIYLDDKDIVRHRLVKKVIDAYKANRKPRLKVLLCL
jgi:phosphate starvation-inducible PhoH-like protein